MNRYRVTWRDEYLFHCYGKDEIDALDQARKLTLRTMRREVFDNLVVKLEPTFEEA